MEAARTRGKSDARSKRRPAGGAEEAFKRVLREQSEKCVRYDLLILICCFERDVDACARLMF